MRKTLLSLWTSLSARRVWIEIRCRNDFLPSGFCHSLRGECGLKSIGPGRKNIWDTSLSARRVWIEIFDTFVYGNSFSVTLCEESVDWNHGIINHADGIKSHSLRGECGLKYPSDEETLTQESRHSLRGECGLKYLEYQTLRLQHSHSLRGECGLKSVIWGSSYLNLDSHSLRGECGLK